MDWQKNKYERIVPLIFGSGSECIMAFDCTNLVPNQYETPYNMVHMIWLILYESYYMTHMYGPYTISELYYIFYFATCRNRFQYQAHVLQINTDSNSLQHPFHVRIYFLSAQFEHGIFPFLLPVNRNQTSSLG